MASSKVYAVLDYKDDYIQPLLLAAIKTQIPPESLVLISTPSRLPDASEKLLQWRQYENIDFRHLVQNADTSLANSYIIRKALIRKHYLSSTVSYWLAKHPDSILKDHVPPSVEFEVDFAEFLDDALLEACELKDSWDRNASLAGSGHPTEWWILKPGMSDRGHGIRLFSSKAELTGIFEEWDPPSDDDEEEDDATSRDGSTTHGSHGGSNRGVMSSELRHFVAQHYIDPPLLLSAPHPSADRKFHIRTYVLATGALQVYVYRPMLALFASKPYTSPSASASPNDDLSGSLTNTCLQSGEREGSVHAFWSLPSQVSAELPEHWQGDVFKQVCAITGEVFEAAARSMGTHFQPLPNAFEIFGLDFMVDARGVAWLLEVNAFPDFAQTGDELRSLVRELVEGVVSTAVTPFFRLPGGGESRQHMHRVLDIDLGRR